MPASGQAAEHPQGILTVAGFAEHLAVEHHHGVGREQDVAFAERLGVGAALELREVERHLFGGQFGRVMLFAVVFRGQLVGESAPGDQLPAAGRLRRQQQPSGLEFFVQ